MTVVLSSGRLTAKEGHPSPCPSSTRGEGTMGPATKPLKSRRVFQLAKSHQPRSLPPCGGGTGRGVTLSKRERSIQS